MNIATSTRKPSALIPSATSPDVLALVDAASRGRVAFDDEGRVLMNSGSAGISQQDVAQTRTTTFVAPAQQELCAVDTFGVSLVETPAASILAEIVDDAIQDVAIGGLSDTPTEVQIRTSSFSSATVIHRTLMARVDTRLAASADLVGTNLVAASAANLARRIANRVEQEAATLVMTSSNWQSANVIALAAGAKWNGGASADPLANLFSAIALSTLPPTHIILPEPLVPWLFTNARFVSFMQAGGAEVLPKIVVARAKLGPRGSQSYIWGNNVALVRVAANANDLGTVRLLRWTGGKLNEPKVTSAYTADGLRVLQQYAPDRGAGGSTIVTVIDSSIWALPEGQPSSIGALITGAFQ